jgi:hypothetical protein
MEFIHHVVNAFNNVPASTWAGLGAWLGGSTGIAVILQVTKYKFKFADAKKFVVFMMGFLSFAASLADFIIQSGATNALPQISSMTAQLMAGAVVMHRFAVSPAYYKLTGLTYRFSKWLDEVAAYQAAQKANKVVEPSAAAVAQAEVTLPAEGDLKQFELN